CPHSHILVYHVSSHSYSFFCHYDVTHSDLHSFPTRRSSDLHNVAISGKEWLDIMPAGANKGAALHHMADTLGIDIAATAAFGDYLNDYELLQEAGTAVAMDNAHPQLKAVADIIAPSNLDHGVITVLSDWFDAMDNTQDANVH